MESERLTLNERLAPSQTGGIQGDSIFSAVFDITYTVCVLEPLRAAHPDIHVYAIHDDTYLVGSWFTFYSRLDLLPGVKVVACLRPTLYTDMRGMFT
mmetsp:Transcript_25119/g.81241  ORF Transcript_25119/g.81241 Transcript_25119/m.81241 type:complete len:97 (+) Transcript_25119:170-460(+)